MQSNTGLYLSKTPELVMSLRIPGRPMTLNNERKLNRFARAAHVKEVRELVSVLAMVEWGNRPPVVKVLISAVPMLKHKRKQDTGGCFPAVKAAIDGLVDAGVLIEDGPDVVKCLVMEAPLLGEPADALELSVWKI